ncbi:MAG: alpha/beta hydrolase [Deltaproteobacteria bacterium]|nr:alpha/beta hydrolase [Deltaproteobacteria bacterium]
MGWIKKAMLGSTALRMAEKATKRAFQYRTGEDEVHYARTKDDWRIGLGRYRARGDSAKAKSRRQRPILLVPGLSANRYTFDIGEGRSLARSLSEQGYDVFVVELRGHGRSQRPQHGTSHSYGWNFDTHLQQDVSAAIDLVLDVTGAPALHWVGHSMGGLLLYALLATESSPRICSGTTVGSTLEFAGAASDFHVLKKILPFTALVDFIPVERIGTLLSPIAARFDSASDRFNYHLENIDAAVVRKYTANIHHDVSSAVFSQLSSALEPGGLLSADGKLRYQAKLSSSQVPVLAIAGSKDRQCAPESVKVTFNALSHADNKMVVFGKEYGHVEDYGHTDLLVGDRVGSEVFPEIISWLEARDSSCQEE